MDAIMDKQSASLRRNLFTVNALNTTSREFITNSDTRRADHVFIDWKIRSLSVVRNVDFYVLFQILIMPSVFIVSVYCVLANTGTIRHSKGTEDLRFFFVHSTRCVSSEKKKTSFMDIWTWTRVPFFWLKMVEFEWWSHWLSANVEIVGTL